MFGLHLGFHFISQLVQKLAGRRALLLERLLRGHLWATNAADGQGGRPRGPRDLGRPG